MSSRSSGQAIVGTSCLAVGMLSLGLGLARPAWAAGSFLTLPAHSLLMIVGSVLALIGGLVLLFIIRHQPEPAPAVPAHVAFYNKMERPKLIPEMMGRGIPAPSGGMAAGGRAIASKPVADEDMIAIDAQIRDLTRRINKAGVMLATGQLSQQGYVAYVEDLKKQRGKLEARRVHAELKGST